MAWSTLTAIVKGPASARTSRAGTIVGERAAALIWTSSIAPQLVVTALAGCFGGGFSESISGTVTLPLLHAVAVAVGRQFPHAQLRVEHVTVLKWVPMAMEMAGMIAFPPQPPRRPQPQQHRQLRKGWSYPLSQLRQQQARLQQAPLQPP